MIKITVRKKTSNSYRLPVVMWDFISIDSTGKLIKEKKSANIPRSTETVENRI